jgi:transcriptional regulator with XRE-family HTH domain
MVEMLTDDEARVNVAANVNELLDERGWSQTMLAQKTGDPISTISAICRARSVSGVGVLGRIAEAFRVNVDRLIFPPPQKSARKAS